MSETKICRDCNEEKSLKDDFYSSPCTYDRRAVYCKECHKKRTAQSVQRQREGLRARGLPQNAYREPKSHNDHYLDRHQQRRERERELEESLMRGTQGQQSDPREMSFADIKYHSLNPPPVFRDLTNYFLRPQTKVSRWKTA